MADFTSHPVNGTNYNAWNTGLLDNGLEAADKTCAYNTVNTCYDSCNKINKCSQCSWSTCIDDGLFVQKLVEHMKQTLCVDTSKVWATGQSNGAMLLHYLNGRFPEMFNKVMPIFGLPLVNELVVKDALGETDILLFYDRSDATIPWKGGMTQDGWIYESYTTVTDEWARVKRCDIAIGMKDYKTPYDGGAYNIACQRKTGCNGPLMFCLYDGKHGTWPTNTENLGWWFFNLPKKEDPKKFVDESI